jgi:ACS family D-galactonate transporter-like MFS transporter
VFLPFVFLLVGRWSPKRARQDEEEHEALVRDELAKLSGQTAGAGAGSGSAPGASRV